MAGLAAGPKHHILHTNAITHRALPYIPPTKPTNDQTCHYKYFVRQLVEKSSCFNGTKVASPSVR